MCGIVGYIGPRQAAGLLLEGLRRLEYRGYDSSGIAIVNGNGLKIMKAAGKLSVLEQALEEKMPAGHARHRAHPLGHARRADHARTPTRTPTRPAGSPSSTTASSRTRTPSGRRSRRAATPSSPRPTPRCWRTWWASSTRATSRRRWPRRCATWTAPTAWRSSRRTSRACSWPRGRARRCWWAWARTSTSSPPTPRRCCSTPARWSTSTTASWWCSPATATGSGTSRRPASASRSTRSTGTWRWSSGTATRTSCSRRSASSPRASATRSAATCSTTRAPPRVSGLNLSDDELKQVERIVITACGTSWHSALIGEYMLEEMARIPVEVEYASEFRYRNPVVDQRTLVIGDLAVAARPPTRWRRSARPSGAGARTVGLVNVVGSTIAREVDGGIYLHAGPEVGVASTKAFTSQVAALALVTLRLARLRNLSILQGRQFIEALRRLPEQIADILERAPRDRGAGRPVPQEHARTRSISAAGSTSRWRSRARSSSRRSPTSTPRATRRRR